ncbi:hypothetical protein RLOC_00000139 [Lonchura striata]|uniref:Uncharacterized protein n=1 Tax=Lonchura striata TaxID=40157 RepID=A0A218UF83_9PASE|nr:hypothetical protein RLOC_00000139 [Lonchura striata domestica]
MFPQLPWIKIWGPAGEAFHNHKFSVC